MKELADALMIWLDKKVDFLVKKPYSEGGTISFGDGFIDTGILNIEVSSISDAINQNASYESFYEISLTLTYQGTESYIDTFNKCREIRNAFRKPWSREIHKNIISLTLGNFEFSDKDDAHYFFSMDMTVYWIGEL